MLSPQPTPASLLYLTKRVRWASSEEVKNLQHIEVCPKAMELTHQITTRIGSDGGGALIIDYGKDGIVSDSLQVTFSYLLKLMKFCREHRISKSPCIFIFP